MDRVRERRLTLPVVASALLLAALGSCDSDPVVEPEPSLQIVPDSVTLTHIGQRFAFSVRGGGGPGADAVRWSSRDTTVFTVDADGTVTARGNGSAGLLVERGRQWSQTPVRVEQAAASLETVGDGQEAVVGIPLWRPVAVRLLDAGGTPVSVATTVRFDASAHGGTADPAEALSDSAGMAWTEWTLGGVPGSQTLVASVAGGVRAEITALALPDVGVCARTPEVAEELVRRTGAADCAGVTDEHLAAIGRLDLGMRGITSLRSGDFAGLSSLQSLKLDRNQLAALPSDIFAGLGNLTSLLLLYNRLTELPPDIFAGLGNLQNLWLHHNRLTALPPSVFDPLAQLLGLNLSDNQLVSLPPGAFGGLTRLLSLRLSDNELAAVPPGIFKDLDSLESLYLHKNRLSELPPDIFAGLTNLRILTLWGGWVGRNELGDLPPGIFDGMSELRSLNLWATNLSQLRSGVFDDLERLEVLDISTNPLYDLPPGVFDRLVALRELHVGGLGLSRLTPGVFDPLEKLEYLNVASNNLDALPPGTFAGKNRFERFLGLDNPGSPFPVAVEFTRTDATDALAPGPARVAMRVPDGAPFEIRIPVSVQGGTPYQAWFEVAAGDTVSAPVVIGSPASGTGAVHVSFGQPPGLPPRYYGLEVVPGSQMVLFAASDNRSPVYREAVPTYWLQAGGAPQPLPMEPYFSDPDGDSLAFAVETRDGGVVGGRIEGGVLWMEPLGEGEAALVVTASDPEGLATSQRVAVQVAPAVDPTRFNINLIFDPGFTEQQKAAMRRAADRWEEVVVGDLPDVPIEGYMDTLGEHGPRMAGVVDDLVFHSVWTPGNSITHAWKRGVREASGLAFYGGASYETGATRWSPGYLQRVAQHEMGHVLGLFPRSTRKFLVESGPPREWHFTGPLAVEAFKAAGGSAYDGPGVPMDSHGVHWRRNVFGEEIMSSAADVISAITLQALADLGHAVDLTKADEYRLPGTGSAGGDAADVPVAEAFELTDGILRLPVVVMDENGKVVRVIRD
ncbi:MAG: leucine-rich repeat protein [Chloroflexi bacterium]|nr:leucine-rich repeat protein [Chloroflexota bacterium]